MALSIVIPAPDRRRGQAPAGIHNALCFLDSGSRQPKADLAGMTSKIQDKFLRHTTRSF